jgi:hypothetical protein
VLNIQSLSFPATTGDINKAFGERIVDLRALTSKPKAATGAGMIATEEDVRKALNCKLPASGHRLIIISVGSVLKVGQIAKH